jgi:hypothetical protein
MSSLFGSGSSGGLGFDAAPLPSSFGFAPTPLSGVADLGEKIRSSLPLLYNSKPFQHYYRRARELREGHSVKWNEGLLSDSLEATKMAFGFVFKNTVAELPLKKVVEPPVKKGLLRMGFLNPYRSA